MEGPNVRRFARLAQNLIRHPGYVRRYWRCAPCHGKQPIDHELPWYSFGAIDYLENYITQDMVVFEYGGGGSTLFYARRAKQVLCAESDPGWAEKIENGLAAKRLTNVRVMVHPFDPRNESAFMESAYYKSVSGVEADVFVIDGYEEEIQLRPHCFWEAERWVKPGGIIILDDSWRYERIRRNNKAKASLVFQSVGPCRYGVTSTDVFLY